MKPREVRYYHSFDEDFVESKEQDHKLPDDYEWIRTDIRSRILSALIYGVAVVFSFFYCRGYLHISFKNKQVLKENKGRGYFIYCNHTQPVGDVFTPAIPVLPKRIYTVVSPANLGIPVIGKLLPYLGALPLPDSVSGMKKLSRAISQRIGEGKCVCIFPEAHVWEYCSFIRPFGESAMKYQVRENAPAYAMTCVYRKSRLFKRPKADVYIDGPFYPDESVSASARVTKLHGEIYSAMCKRAEASDYSYIQYEEAQ